MMIFAIIFVLVTSVTAHVIAAPNPGLAKRGIVYEADCDDAQDKLTQPALYDVEVIANNVLNGRLPDGTAFADSTAFTNYFEPADLLTVLNMFSLLSQIRSPRSAPQFTLNCGDAPNAQPPEFANPAEQCNDPNVLAYPDPTPAGWLINQSSPPPASGLGLCPFFFTGPGLGRTTVHSHPRSYWCSNQSNTFEFYETVGRILIMTLTQTDAFGSAVGLPAHSPIPGTNPRVVEPHGAVVFEASWDTGWSPWQQARDLKDAGEGQQTERLQSAWSYAAAATEWYFLVLCGWEEVDIPA